MTDLKQAAMQQALEALSAELLMMLDKPVDEQYRVRYAYLLRVITALREALAQPPLPVQEPVTWDKPSASFDEWWDGDRRRDNANPFQTDSFAYWAWEGWQAALAQRPWQGLTEEEIAVIGDKVANEQLVGPVSNFRVRLARAIEAKLKERNT